MAITSPSRGELGISVRTLHNWEQGRRVPDGSARALLQVAAKHPEAILDVVHPVVQFSEWLECPERRAKFLPTQSS